jgi:hypothetical protein
LNNRWGFGAKVRQRKTQFEYFKKEEEEEAVVILLVLFNRNLRPY